jgi:hypothetical protein
MRTDEEVPAILDIQDGLLAEGNEYGEDLLEERTLFEEETGDTNLMAMHPKGATNMKPVNNNVVDANRGCYIGYIFQQTLHKK